MYAADSGSTECIQILTSSGAALLDVGDNDGETALMFAAKKGHAPCISTLLAHACVDALARQGADLNLPDRRGITPLMYAAYMGACVSVLLAKGADRDLVDSDGQTALSYASDKWHVECMRALGATLDNA
jgi:uncharacterized protein